MEIPLKSNFSLLIVDDEKVILEILKDFLKLEGFRVTTAISGEDAMQLLHKDPFDLVITDLKMPGITGLDLLKHVAQRFPHTVTIVMTGFGTLETAIDCMKSGAYDYILKPFKVDEVVHIVKRGLEKKRLEEENIQLKEIVSLYNASEAISASLSLDNALHLLLETAASLVKCDCAALYLKNWRTKEFELKRVKKSEEFEHVTGLERISAGKLLKSHQQRTPILVIDGNLADLDMLPKDLKTEIKSFCSLPLRVKDRVIGLLNIYSCSQKEKITEGQRKTLSMLSDRTAVAIENATLYSNLQQHFFQTIDSFLKAIEAKDPYTHGHSERVRKYSETIVGEMKVNSNFIKVISQAALLHDIGKISVDLSELNHPGQTQRKTEEPF